MTTYRVLATPKYRGWWSDSQHEFKEEFTEYGFIEKISGKTLRNAFSNLRKLNFILAFAHNIFSFSTYIYFKRNLNENGEVKFKINLADRWATFEAERMV